MQVHDINLLLAIIIFSIISYNHQVFTRKNHLHAHHYKQHPTHRLKHKIHPHLQSEFSDQVLQTRIIGGNMANATSFPYVAALYYCDKKSSTTSLKNCQKFCEGSIIGKLHILTVAHCLDGKNAPQVAVRVGVKDLSHPEAKGTIFQATKLILHPKYDKTKRLNDIAMIKLQQAMTFTASINRIYISGVHYHIDWALLNVIIAAWGQDAAPDPMGNKLKYAKLLISNFFNCVGQGHELTLQFCVHVYNYQEGYPCAGDDGAALLPLNYYQDYFNIIAGLFSGTGHYDANGQIQCATIMFFVNVSTYAQWINTAAGQ